MKALLVAEGAHELGSDADSSPLAALIRRVIPPGVGLECRKVSDRCVEVQLTPGKYAANYEKRLIGWLRYAEKSGYVAVVIVIDEDGKRDRRTGVANAHASQMTPVPRAIGIAIRSFDAWMLADEQALTAVLGQTIQRQPEPEEIHDPKECFRRLTERPYDLSQSEAYRELARRMDVDRVASRCRDGFAPFLQRLRELAVRLQSG